MTKKFVVKKSIPQVSESYISDKHVFNHLRCERITYLDYHTDPKFKARSPSWVVQKSREKRSLLRTIYSEKNVHWIRPHKNVELSADETLQAIKNGEEYIGNAVLKYDKYVAKIDMLQKVTFSEETQYGNIYFPAEVISSDELSTDQFFRLVFLCFVLGKMQTLFPLTAKLHFFDGRLKIVRIDEITSDGNNILDKLTEYLEKIEIIACTEVKNFNAPSIKYTNKCKLCEWRYKCIPDILISKPLTLIPIIGPARAEYLKNHNLSTICDLKSTSREYLSDLNFDSIEIGQIEYFLKRICDNKILFKKRFHGSMFDDAVPLTFSMRKVNQFYIPAKGFYYEQDSIKSIPSTDNGNRAQYSFSLPDFLTSSPVWLFGHDYEIFKRIIEQNGWHGIDFYNLSDFIEKNITSPLPGIELTEILSFIDNKGIDGSFKSPQRMYLKAIDRLKGVKRIIEWLRYQMD